MKKRNKIPKSTLREILRNMPESTIYLQEQVDITTQERYFQTAIQRNEYDIPSHEASLEALNSAIDVESIEQTLVNLAGMGSVEAYRTIEHYLETHKDDRSYSWALMALQECRLLLESYLTDEPIAFVSGGLGALGDKLRYFAAVATLKGDALTSAQKQRIEFELEDLTQTQQVIVEKTEFGDNYVTIIFLAALSVSIGDFLEHIIVQWNNDTDFMYQGYYLANTHIPTTDELLRYFNSCWEDFS